MSTIFKNPIAYATKIRQNRRQRKKTEAENQTASAYFFINFPVIAICRNDDFFAYFLSFFFFPNEANFASIRV